MDSLKKTDFLLLKKLEEVRLMVQKLQWGLINHDLLDLHIFGRDAPQMVKYTVFISVFATLPTTTCTALRWSYSMWHGGLLFWKEIVWNPVKCYEIIQTKNKKIFMVMFYFCKQKKTADFSLW